MKVKRSFSNLSLKQKTLIVLPWLLIISTYFAFRSLVNISGSKWGYFTGFLFYWLLWCYLIPIWLIGLDGIRETFKKTENPLGKLNWLGVLLLLLPPILAGSTVFIVKVTEASWLVILASLGLATD